MKKPARLVVLISGNGSNLQAIIDACAQKIINAELVGVIANKADSFGLERARKAQVPTQIKLAKPAQARADYDRELASEVAAFKPDWIILAGWMRILSLHFLEHFPQKVINLHPALPGAFPGVGAIERAWIAYQNKAITHTGVMVHLVPDAEVDAGPVLNQVNVPIEPHDTLATLSARMHAAEHALLIKTLQELTL